MSKPKPKSRAKRPSGGGDGRAARSIPPARQLRASKVSQAVASAIVERIVAEDLQPGDRLPTEAQMLADFNVGRASIREALRVLEVYGLISIRQGQKGGPMVAPLSPSDLGRTLSFFFHLDGTSYRELIEARLTIEPVMARLAAERQDAELLEALRDVMEREGTSSPEDEILCAEEFHYRICGASGNKALDLLGRSLRTVYASRISAAGILPPESHKQIHRTHAQIGKAILAGNGKRAERLMADHLRELADLQEERTPWFMEERISWEG